MGVNKVIYNGNTLIDLTGTTATADKILSGYGAYGADGVWMDGTASGGGGGTMNKGILRTDAELLQTWTSDTYAVADEGLTLPTSYSTSSQTLRTVQTLDTYTGDPTAYRYVVTIRTLTIPTYSIATLAKGREEYVMCATEYEWVYNPSGEIATLDGSTTYGQYSQMVGHTIAVRYVYWKSASAISPYTSSAYGFNQVIQAPSIASNKTITIKAPTVIIRGHATYFTQTFYEALTDVRLQYVIELWRIPVNTPRGWAHESQMAHIFDCIVNNNQTLT